MVLKNADGKYFIVRDFSGKPVNESDIAEGIMKIKKSFGRAIGRDNQVFRVVFVGTQFDQPFFDSDSMKQIINRLDKLNHRFKIDILKDERNTYVPLWIG